MEPTDSTDAGQLPAEDRRQATRELSSGPSDGKVDMSHRPRSDARVAWSDGSDVVVLHHELEPSHEPRAPGIEIRLVVGAEGASNFYAGFTENLSECGVFVATTALLGIGSTVDLRIYLPHKEPIRARGTVRWQRVGATAAARGIGIRFDHLSAGDTKSIQEFAETRAPLFFDDEDPESTQRRTPRP